MTKVRADMLQVGDVIMPPAREVQLWMRRHCKDHNLPETALHLTITNIDEAQSDKRGRWLKFTANQSPLWNAHWPFTFTARPETPWQKI